MIFQSSIEVGAEEINTAPHHRVKRDVEKVDYVHPAARRDDTFNVESGDYVTSGASSKHSSILQLSVKAVAKLLKDITSYFHGTEQSSTITCDEQTCPEEANVEVVEEKDNNAAIPIPAVTTSSSENEEKPIKSKPENSQDSSVVPFTTYTIVTGQEVCTGLQNTADGGITQECTYPGVIVRTDSLLGGCHTSTNNTIIHCPTMDVITIECSKSRSVDNKESITCNTPKYHNIIPTSSIFANESEIKTFLSLHNSSINQNASCVVQMMNIYNTASDMVGTSQPLVVAPVAIAVSYLASILSVSAIPGIQFVPSAKHYHDSIKEYLPMKGVPAEIIAGLTTLGVIAATTYNPMLQLALNFYTVFNKINTAFPSDANSKSAIFIATATIIGSAVKTDLTSIVDSVPAISQGMSNLQHASALHSFMKATEVVQNLPENIVHTCTFTDQFLLGDTLINSID